MATFVGMNGIPWPCSHMHAFHGLVHICWHVPDMEIKRYRESLGPKAIKVSGALSLDLTVFWNSVVSDVPKLSACALKYIYACLNSAHAERSFSIYNLVFSERRRSLNEDNLRALVFLYYNNFISYESLM